MDRQSQATETDVAGDDCGGLRFDAWAAGHLHSLLCDGDTKCQSRDSGKCGIADSDRKRAPRAPDGKGREQIIRKRKRNRNRTSVPWVAGAEKSVLGCA